jgi:hypothetical protein
MRLIDLHDEKIAASETAFQIRRDRLEARVELALERVEQRMADVRLFLSRAAAYQVGVERRRRSNESATARLRGHEPQDRFGERTSLFSR